jgi:SAM-dependent methyltransferase
MQLLACPICNTQLKQAGSIFACTNSHTFDIAREGYVNLMRKQLPGDTKEMLIARRDFLERGYYQPLSDMLNELVGTYLADSASPANILDAGCGEGYYLARLQQYLTDQHYQAQYIGLDISKEAARMAAKRYKQPCFVVANIKERLPFVDHSIHAILNIFAPRNPAEFARVLTPDGLLLVAIPAPDHLVQLRSALQLLSIEEHKQQKVIDQFADSFEFVTSSALTYTARFSHDEIVQTVMMTPNYWHMSDEMRAKMEALEALEISLEFNCLVFRLHKSAR